MPSMLATDLRQRSEDCLRRARLSSDPAVKAELVVTAARLYEQAAKFERFAGKPPKAMLLRSTKRPPASSQLRLVWPRTYPQI